MATDNTRLLDAESQATNCTYKKITTQVIAVDNSRDSEGFHCGEVPVLSSCVTTSTCGGYQILRECEEPPANAAVGVSVSFRNVRYTIETAERKESNGGVLDSAMSQLSMCRRKRTETILHGVSGHVPAGKLLAIMGPSGSGKTTLVDILALRPKTGKATGHVAWQVLQTPPSVDILQSMQTANSTLDMVRYTPVESHNLAAYVMQDDVFLGNLTVRETLRYSLRLKQKCESDTARENKLIDTWISKMKLDKVADKPVGTPLKRGISGGERRRLSIAVEMLTSPSLLFIDEVTTGLDAQNALRVMESVKRLSVSGCTVICTIHQPRSSIYHMFDYVMLMNEGSCVYFGPTHQVESYFSALELPCPSFTNPADFLLDLLEVGGNEDYQEVQTTHTDKEIKGECHVVTQTSLAIKGTLIGIPKISPALLGEKWKASPQNMSLESEKHCGEDSNISEQYKSQKAKKPATSVFSQFLTLSHRSWRQTLRDPGIMYVRTGATIGIALLVGAIFFGQPDDESSVDARINTMLFLMCVFALFCLPAISKYIDDRLLYSREHSSKLYSTGAYFFSEFFVELPILVVIVIIYGCISYWMVNLNPDPGRFFFFLWIILSVILVGFSVSQAIAAAVSSVNMAIAIYMLVLVYSLLLGGFIVSANDLPKATQWLLRTSYFFYGFEALVINEFEGKSYGQDVIDSLGFSGNKFVDAAALVIFFIVLRFLTYLLLRFMVKEKR